MVINIFLLLIFIGCIVKIILLLVSKFPVVANIDLSRIPREKERQTKQILFERHIKKRLNSQKK